MIKIQIDDQEQRSRNVCLFIHEINELEDEDMNTDSLGIALPDVNIQGTHRLGPKRILRITDFISIRTGSRQITEKSIWADFSFYHIFSCVAITL